jgi:hypothetical protein
MKIKNIFLFLISSIVFCLEPNEEGPNTKYIVFSNDKIKAEKGITISGTAVLIDKPGVYLVTGESKEGNIVIKSDSVKLYLKNLHLSSEMNAPIIITSDKKDVKIINIDNTKLEDLEDPLTTEGECAVIKIKRNSIVHFQNEGTFKLFGNCKNIIR